MAGSLTTIGKARGKSSETIHLKRNCWKSSPCELARKLSSHAGASRSTISTFRYSRALASSHVLSPLARAAAGQKLPRISCSLHLLLEANRKEIFQLLSSGSGKKLSSICTSSVFALCRYMG
ncbi:hypothetical protein KP509_04G105900 [Ceratopteris richardii]|uniref:Uncharacterized protein n=1 Tax=Ceratopteris richardii TaxID=49495 RepID=A0A8T2UYW2_CERRI|nr:hypothetical protein KP509_04G105900 [Ceratopteris richardii]